MAQITVTVSPEMLSISGFSFKRVFNSFLSVPVYYGNTVIGFDKKKIAIRAGKKPYKITFEPYLLTSEDLELLISEDSILNEQLLINVSIKHDDSGVIFPVDSEGKPTEISPPNLDNWPDGLNTSNDIIEVNKNSSIVLFDINVPRRAKFSFSLIDVTTRDIELDVSSYYSLDSGVTWNTRIAKIDIPENCPGRILIYLDITEVTPSIISESQLFILKCETEEDITLLTAEYGESPDISSKGEVLIPDLLEFGKYLTRQSGKTINPIPYGTFRRCINNNGGAEYYGDSRVEVINGNITISYTYFESVSNRCIK